MSIPVNPAFSRLIRNLISKGDVDPLEELYSYLSHDDENTTPSRDIEKYITADTRSNPELPRLESKTPTKLKATRGKIKNLTEIPVTASCHKKANSEVPDPTLVKSMSLRSPNE